MLHGTANWNGIGNGNENSSRGRCLGGEGEEGCMRALSSVPACGQKDSFSLPGHAISVVAAVPVKGTEGTII